MFVINVGNVGNVFNVEDILPEVMRSQNL